MSKKLTTSEVINQFIEKHGNEYDYSLVEYKGANSKVDIICKEHGVFSQTPNKHKQGRGCPTCGGSKQLTTSIVIIQFIEKHGNQYDYSLVEYKNDNTKVDIICKEHGVFSQSPCSHKNGVGCPKCSVLKNCCMKTFSTSEIINQFIENMEIDTIIH